MVTAIARLVILLLAAKGLRRAYTAWPLVNGSIACLMLILPKWQSHVSFESLACLFVQYRRGSEIVRRVFLVIRKFVLKYGLLSDIA